MTQPIPRPAGHRFAAGIFREYDIRGVAGKTLSEEDAWHIGRAFAAQAMGHVAIGRDGRKSSPALAGALTQGLMDGAADIVDIGIGPTPMLYFATHMLKCAGGVMVTGSHNPPDHNGFKFVLHGKAFYGKAIQDLKTAAESALPKVAGQSGRRSEDMREPYLETLTAAYDGARNLNFAWDAGNGAAGEIMAALIRRLPGRHVALNETIDGTFPVHHPDPSVAENLRQLIVTVRTRKLDGGIAFDGDGDRIGVVDDEGEILWGDQLLMLYAADVLKERPGATVIADVKASQVLFDEVKRLGGAPLIWKTGHSLIKTKMAETGAPLAGEMSGHMFFADKYYGYDDALYAAVRLLGLLSRSGKKLSELKKALPKAVNTPEIRFACDDDRKFKVIEEVKARLKAAGADFSDIDGVRVNTPEGWWLLRASNTQAVLVARCEAKDASALERIKEDLRHQLSLSSVALP